MSNKMYDVLKNIILPLLTGLDTFVITVGEVWAIPYYKQIAITLGAMATLLSFILNEASKQYMKDKLIVDNYYKEV